MIKRFVSGLVSRISWFSLLPGLVLTMIILDNFDLNNLASLLGIVVVTIIGINLIDDDKSHRRIQDFNVVQKINRFILFNLFMLFVYILGCLIAQPLIWALTEPHQLRFFLENLD